MVFGSDSQKGRQSPPNTRKPKGNTQRSERDSQCRCSSDRKVHRPCPKSPMTDTKPTLPPVGMGHARRIGRTQIRVCTDHIRFTRQDDPPFSSIRVLYLWAYSSYWQINVCNNTTTSQENGLIVGSILAKEAAYCLVDWNCIHCVQFINDSYPPSPCLPTHHFNSF